MTPRCAVAPVRCSAPGRVSPPAEMTCCAPCSWCCAGLGIRHRSHFWARPSRTGGPPPRACRRHCSTRHAGGTRCPTLPLWSTVPCAVTWLGLAKRFPPPSRSATPPEQTWSPFCLAPCPPWRTLRLELGRHPRQFDLHAPSNPLEGETHDRSCRGAPRRI